MLYELSKEQSVVPRTFSGYLCARYCTTIFLQLLKMSLEELKEDGYARFTMPIRDEFMQGDGVMQGGLTAERKGNF